MERKIKKSNKKIIFLCGVLLCFAGCSRVSVERYVEYSSEKNITVEVREDETVTNWWGPVKSEIKNKIIKTIKEEFSKFPVSLVKKKAKVVVMLQDIVTVGEVDRVQIEEVILSVSVEKERIFKLRYKQKPTYFPDDWYKFWRYAKGPELIARQLADRVICELKIKRGLVPSNVSADKKRPAKRGYIIYRPLKD